MEVGLYPEADDGSYLPPVNPEEHPLHHAVKPAWVMRNIETNLKIRIKRKAADRYFLWGSVEQ